MKNHSTSYSTCRFIKVRQLNQVAIKLKKKNPKKKLDSRVKGKAAFLNSRSRSGRVVSSLTVQWHQNHFPGKIKISFSYMYRDLIWEITHLCSTTNDQVIIKKFLRPFILLPSKCGHYFSICLTSWKLPHYNKNLKDVIIYSYITGNQSTYLSRKAN